MTKKLRETIDKMGCLLGTIELDVHCFNNEAYGRWLFETDDVVGMAELRELLDILDNLTDCDSDVKIKSIRLENRGDAATYNLYCVIY